METEDLNNILKLDKTDIYRTLLPRTAKYTFYLSARRTFSRDRLQISINLKLLNSQGDRKSH